MTWEQLELFERWLPVVGYEGKYEVSNWGRLRRVATGKGAQVGKILHLYKQNGGYLQVNLCGGKCELIKRVLIHRLVMAAFVGPCPSGKEVHHLDGDKTHNSVLNLRYLSRSENVREDHKAGRRNHKGERHAQHKVTRNDVIEMRRLRTEGMTYEALRKQFGISNHRVFEICNGEGWTHVLQTQEENT